VEMKPAVSRNERQAKAWQLHSSQCLSSNSNLSLPPLPPSYHLQPTILLQS
jgi:hypothetical protein